MVAKTPARSMAPTPVTTQASNALEPYTTATPARAAGSRNTPEPIMFPITIAVAVQRPISRLSSGRPALMGRATKVFIVPLLVRWEVGSPRPSQG